RGPNMRETWSDAARKASAEARRLKISDAQRTALDSHGIFEGDPNEGEQHILDAMKGNHLHLTPENTEKVASAVNDISNAHDERAQNETDPERAKWYRADSKALANLYSNILKTKQSMREVRAVLVEAGDWDEQKHPRGEHGRFGAGSGTKPPEDGGKAT